MAAVRVKDITKQGVRVYRDGKIGIAVAVGDAPKAELLQGAVETLKAGIPYPYALPGNLQDRRDCKPEPMRSQEQLEHAEPILQVLEKDYSDFIFSESFSA